MEQTLRLMKIIVFAIVFSSVKCNRLHLSAALLDQQLRLLEQIIVISEPSNANVTHFMQTHEMPAEVKKRLFVRIRCSDVAKTRMLAHLRKYNELLATYFNYLYPGNQIDYDPMKLKATIDELTANTKNLRTFCLYELPNLYFKFGEELGMKFNQNELDRREELSNANRQRNANATMETVSLDKDGLGATTNLSRFFR